MAAFLCLEACRIVTQAAYAPVAYAPPFQVRDLKELFDCCHVPHPDLPDDHPSNKLEIEGFNRWPAQPVRACVACVLEPQSLVHLLTLLPLLLPLVPLLRRPSSSPRSSSTLLR